MIEPFLCAWMAKRLSASGHESQYELRVVVNTTVYQNRTVHFLPNDLTPWPGDRTGCSRVGAEHDPYLSFAFNV